MNELSQIKEGIVLVIVIIIFIFVFQFFGYLDKKSRHSSLSDEITQEESWAAPEKMDDETIIIKPAASAPKDSASTGKSLYFHPLTPDQQRAADQLKKKEAESKKAGW
ncbi:MAG TPA: hypothetical protein PLE74_12000 [Candidatus Cloacimonadota bacterium]|nr:hypothetical protein [Candidatus Cloacimonadota bacterium]HPT72988.1 hypothetical protein [Candidatus Cloacimonadota bacterium]